MMEGYQINWETISKRTAGIVPSITVPAANTQVVNASKRRVGLIFSVAGGVQIGLNTRPLLSFTDGFLVGGPAGVLYLPDWLVGAIVKSPWFAFGSASGVLGIIEIMPD